MSFDPITHGVHYHTWRNIIARESLAEKEEGFDASNNPERIPESEAEDRYQDQNFIQCVQPLQVFSPITLAGGRKQVTKKNGEKEMVQDKVLGGIRGVVQAAVKSGLKVKAVGTGHSFSDIATTSDFLIVTDGLNEMLENEMKAVNGYTAEQIKRAPNIRHFPFLHETIKTKGYTAFLESFQPKGNRQPVRSFYGRIEDNPNLVEFEAGIKIAALNEALWKRKKSLYNMGTYQGQSFIGAASTSTHGSGHTLPPLPDMIKSMVIVADSGLIFRIEPTKGITQRLGGMDRSKLPSASADVWEELIGKGAITNAAEEHVDFLVQDDDWFASALVNVGTFGIVYSVIIEVVPMYYLLETVEYTTWEKLKPRLETQSKFLLRNSLPPTLRTNDPDFGTYSELFERKPFTARFPHDYHRKCENPDPLDLTLNVSEIRQTTIEIHPHIYELEGKPHHICSVIRQYKVNANGNFVTWAAHRSKVGRKAEAAKGLVSGPLNVSVEEVRHDSFEQEEKHLTDVLLTASAILRPVDYDQIFDLVEAGQFPEHLMKKVIKKITVEPPCSKYYLSRNYLTQVVPLFPGYGVELAFSTKQTANSGNLPAYIAAVDKVLDMAQKHWEEGRYIQTSPIALRMVKASNAYLSMQHNEKDEPTCMIELLNQIDTHGGKELFYRYERELFKLGARPHWGLDLSVTTGNNGLLYKMYPKFTEWRKVYGALNYRGTFNNRFTDRMGL